MLRLQDPRAEHLTRDLSQSDHLFLASPNRKLGVCGLCAVLVGGAAGFVRVWSDLCGWACGFCALFDKGGVSGGAGGVL